MIGMKEGGGVHGGRVLGSCGSGGDAMVDGGMRSGPNGMGLRMVGRVVEEVV